MTQTSSPAILAAAFALLAAAPLAAQVPPGQYLASVAVGPAATPTTGEMYLVDPATNKATLLTIPTSLQTGVTNCIAMLSPGLGFVGTQGKSGASGVPADIFRITMAGTAVTSAVQLNNQQLGGYNLAQIAIVGGLLYFTTADATTTNGLYGGLLYSLPLTGGSPTLVENLSGRTDWPTTTSSANALASDGKTVYIGVWPAGLVYAHNALTKSTTVLMTLPPTKLNNTSTYYPLNMQMKSPATTSGILAVCGLYGDVCLIDVAQAKVLDHWFHPTPIITGMQTTKNSFAENPDAGDWGIGTRDGALDVVVPTGPGQLARRHVDGLGSSSNLLENSVNGLWYNPGGGAYTPFGPGCAGSASYLPTSVSRGAAKQGNSAFAFGLDTTLGGPSVAVLIIGTTDKSPFPIDLTAAGAPGCFLRTDLTLLAGAAVQGPGNGLGHGILPLPLPNISLQLFTQWAVIDAAANKLGIAMSDGRQMRL